MPERAVAEPGRYMSVILFFMSEPEPGLTQFFFLSMFIMDTACLVQLHMCKTHATICVTENKSNFQDGSAAFQTTGDALQGKPL